jgi:hypothetical protein
MCDDIGVKAESLAMIEGSEAFTRFRAALKAVLAVPKSAMPASPFKKSAPKKKKPARKS